MATLLVPGLVYAGLSLIRSGNIHVDHFVALHDPLGLAELHSVFVSRGGGGGTTRPALTFRAGPRASWNVSAGMNTRFELTVEPEGAWRLQVPGCASAVEKQIDVTHTELVDPRPLWEAELHWAAEGIEGWIEARTPIHHAVLLTPNATIRLGSVDAGERIDVGRRTRAAVRGGSDTLTADEFQMVIEAFATRVTDPMPGYLRPALGEVHVLAEVDSAAIDPQVTALASDPSRQLHAQAFGLGLPPPTHAIPVGLLVPWEQEGDKIRLYVSDVLWARASRQRPVDLVVPGLRNHGYLPDYEESEIKRQWREGGKTALIEDPDAVRRGFREIAFTADQSARGWGILMLQWEAEGSS